ncbi:SAM-dependent methyltransferase [Streptomyces sp. NPDC051286]|uniref:SAM-dependent methyltransferase n=1 Tax=Streptomyces sp. NPDC051286 TaxID=3365647 RepID=UPI0037A1FC85
MHRGRLDYRGRHVPGAVLGDAGLGGEGSIAAMEFWNAHVPPPITARSRAEIAGFLDGLDLVEPGPVPCSRWRAAFDSAAVIPQFGVVAVKR